MQLIIKPVPASPSLMEFLETKAVITRITPNSNLQITPKGQNNVSTIYASDVEYGSHKLIAVTINKSELTHLISHPDREDFMLIGQPERTPLILTISLLKELALKEKIKKGMLSSEDFIAFYCDMNNPETSFFTMNPDYPHGESCMIESNFPPSFFVGEPTNLLENFTTLAPYVLSFEHGGT